MPAHRKRDTHIAHFPIMLQAEAKGTPNFQVAHPGRLPLTHLWTAFLSLLIVTFLNLCAKHCRLVCVWQNIMTKSRQVAFLYNLVSFPSVGNHPLFSFSYLEIYNPFPFSVVVLLCCRIPEPFSELTRFRYPASSLSFPPFSSLSHLKGLLFYSLLLDDQL